jgi:hypothetical protein
VTYLSQVAKKNMVAANTHSQSVPDWPLIRVDAKAKVSNCPIPHTYNLNK